MRFYLIRFLLLPGLLAQLSLGGAPAGPLAENDFFSVFDGSTSNPLRVLRNDRLPTGSVPPLQILSIDPRFATGSLAISADQTQILYTPPGPVGVESFRYTVEDENGATSEATVTVNIAFPGLSELTLTDPEILENAGVPLEFLLEISPIPTNTIRVVVETEDLSARVEHGDYLAFTNTLIIDPGMDQLLIPVDILGDTEPELDEEMRLRINSVENARIVKAFGSGKILADDPVVRLSLRFRDAQHREIPGPIAGEAFSLQIIADDLRVPGFRHYVSHISLDLNWDPSPLDLSSVALDSSYTGVPGTLGSSSLEGLYASLKGGFIPFGFNPSVVALFQGQANDFSTQPVSFSFSQMTSGVSRIRVGGIAQDLTGLTLFESFSIPILPPRVLISATDILDFNWPDLPTPFQLEQSTGLVPPQWSPISGSEITMEDDRLHWRTPVVEPLAVFRLNRPE